MNHKESGFDKKWLTWPPDSAILLVSFIFRKQMFGLVIQCSPDAGESGCGTHFFWISGSAFPATIQRELWNLYLWSSAGRISMKRQYFAVFERPDRRIWGEGNILLKQMRYRSCFKSTVSLKIEPFWQKREKGAIYENFFGGNCGGTIGANAAQKRNRGMIRWRKTSNLLNKSISDTQLAYIYANLADNILCSLKISSEKRFRNQISR